MLISAARTHAALASTLPHVGRHCLAGTGHNTTNALSERDQSGMLSQCKTSALLAPTRCTKPFRASEMSSRSALQNQRSRLIVRAEAQEDAERQSASPQQKSEQQQERPEAPTPLQPQLGRRRQADSTDWFATNITRRFGLAGGLAWLGFLTFGVVSEQIKTRLEVASDERGTKDVTDAEEVKLPSGVRYVDLRTGGGQHAAKGLLLVLELKLTASGEVVADTAKTGKQIVTFAGRRPLTGGLSPGAEEALLTMKAGGKRRIFVPSTLGFGADGGILRPTEHVPNKEGVIPPNADLEYELELVRVSVPPS